ncbi:MAG: class I SAM-dependent methyltransferase [Candidatus Omnitrophica bacterium]|nr:class I SAM-dependent methyltransferase [Candidatus Omnitrophota bacterium]
MSQPQSPLISDDLVHSRIVPQILSDKDVTYQEHLSKYKFALKFINKESIVLDVACGVGWGTSLLAGQVKKVTGVDHSNTALDYARKNYKAENLEFKPMSALDLKFPEDSFDAVISVETIAQLSDPYQFLSQVHNLLKPQGVFLASTVNKEVFPSRGFTYQEILSLFETRFCDIEVYMQKMAYFGFKRKKLRQLLGGIFLPKLLKGKIPCIEKRYSNLASTPLFWRQALYEYKLKLSVLPFFEQEACIKPNFYIVVCRKK